VLALTGAAGADPVPFASVSDTCRLYVSLPPVDSSHRAPLMRVVSQGAAGFFASWQESGFYAVSFRQDDIVWNAVPSHPDPDAPLSLMSCNRVGPFTVDLYDTPSAPTSFTGAMTAGGPPPISNYHSTLPFIAAADGRYEATVSLTQGAIELTWGGSQLKEFASSGSIDLGVLEQGYHAIQVRPRDGPQARYTISIRAVPVSISGVAFSAPTSRPGVAVRVSYTLSGGASVGALVVNSKGQALRTLADDLPVSRGPHSLTWDGLDAEGNPVADGQYTVRLTVVDAGGSQTSGEAEITIDGHGPVIAFKSRLTNLDSHTGLAVQVTDGIAGVRSASLRVGGATVARLQPSTTSIVYRPTAGWKAGATYRVSVIATDKAGNQTLASRSLHIKRVAVAKPTPATTTVTPAADQSKVVMPNVVGMRMDRATRRLRSIGLRVNEECGGIFGCIVKANWWICEQDPRPGRRLNRYTVVVIYGERRGEC